MSIKFSREIQLTIAAVALSLGALGFPSAIQADSRLTSGVQVAQSPTPKTYITSADANQLVIQITEGEFKFHGWLKRTQGNMFVGSDDQVQVTYDRDTGRIVVMNQKNGTEFYNYLYTAASKPKPTSETFSPYGDAVNAAKQACLTAVAKQVAQPRAKLSIIRAQTAQSGIGVDVKVPGAQAPWFCLTDNKGKVQEVRYSGSEGRL